MQTSLLHERSVLFFPLQNIYNSFLAIWSIWCTMKMFQICFCLQSIICPCQHCIRLFTSLGNTQCTPKTPMIPWMVPKSAMSGHSVEVNDLVASTDLSQKKLLHIIIPLLWRVSCAMHTFLAGIHPKQVTLGRNLVLQINFRGQSVSQPPRFFCTNIYALVTVQVTFYLPYKSVNPSFQHPG